MKNTSNNNKLIYRISLIAVIGNTILAVSKILGGIIFDSLAVLGDGLDSTGDIFSSIVLLYAARIINQPPDRCHPYGHQKADAIASKALSFFVLFAGIQLAISSFGKILSPTAPVMPSTPAIIVTLFSVFGKSILMLMLFKTGKASGSTMLVSNAKNMRADIIISLSVFIGLGGVFIFQAPILDAITAFLVSLWIIRVGYFIFLETNSELMDGIGDEYIYELIFKAVKEVPQAFNPHRVRARKIGNSIFIDMDIEIDPQKTVQEAHDISMKVEQTVKKYIPNVLDINVHIEPLGNNEEEVFGISENC
ncbi:MAG: cation diffusion facilitator family transporter [Bacteroidales bacterium]